MKPNFPEKMHYFFQAQVTLSLLDNNGPIAHIGMPNLNGMTNGEKIYW